jgi:isocitrate/isopropylmalate dehydrogenase
MKSSSSLGRRDHPGPCDSYAYSPVEQGGVNPSTALRKRLDLYANIRPRRGALEEALADPRRKTRDIGGKFGTKAFDASLVAAIDRMPRPR